MQIGEQSNPGVILIPPRPGSYLAAGMAYKVASGLCGPIEVRPQHTEELIRQGWRKEADIQAAAATRHAAVVAKQRDFTVPARPIPVGDPVVRVLPPSGGKFRVMSANGRLYNGQDGGTQDVPACDARALCANGWILLGVLGTAENRPKRSVVNDRRFEGEDGCNWAARVEVIFDGLNWRNCFSGEIVPNQ